MLFTRDSWSIQWYIATCLKWIFGIGSYNHMWHEQVGSSKGGPDADESYGLQKSGQSCNLDTIISFLSFFLCGVFSSFMIFKYKWWFIGWGYKPYNTKWRVGIYHQLTPQLDFMKQTSKQAKKEGKKTEKEKKKPNINQQSSSTSCSANQRQTTQTSKSQKHSTIRKLAPNEREISFPISFVPKAQIKRPLTGIRPNPSNRQLKQRFPQLSTHQPWNPFIYYTIPRI